MNPLTNVKNIKKLSEQELKSGSKTSWHDEYRDSAWIFIGGLPYDLTEGDIICVFSQYGEVVNINLVRDKGSGKSKGYCFLCYEDARSAILAVDNLNGIKILKRTIRVDHVKDYKAPKENSKMTAEARRLMEEGCAPTSDPEDPPPPPIKEEPKFKVKTEMDVKEEPLSDSERKQGFHKKRKKSKQEKKSSKKSKKESRKSKKRSRRDSSRSSSSSSSLSSSSDED